MLLRSPSRDVVEGMRKLNTQIAVVGWLLLEMAIVRGLSE